VPSTLKEGRGQPHIHRYAAVLHRGIYARNLARNNALRCIDRDFLARLNVFGLGLGDVQFGLEFFGIRHTGKIGARRTALPDFNRQQLEHTVNARLNLQLVALAFLEGIDGVPLADPGPPFLELRRDRLLADFETIGQRVGVCLVPLQIQRRNKSVLFEFGIRLETRTAASQSRSSFTFKSA
jgi:hypothetical protein